MAKELLTDVTVRNAKPTDKDQRLNDGGGLYLPWIQVSSAILVIMRLWTHFQQKTRHGVFGNSMFFLVGC